MAKEPAQPKTPADRLADLEFLFTHLERQVAELGRVVLEQQRRIELIEKQVRAMREARQPEDGPDEEPEEL
jgi:uncharacterized coiled-coil protein SlyX